VCFPFFFKSKLYAYFVRWFTECDVAGSCLCLIYGWDLLRECCATNRKVAGSIPASVSGFFVDIKSFRSHYGPWVESASNRNEYQEYFLGVKAAGTPVRKTGNLPPFCAVVTKSGNLNFLEPSGPLRVCNGTALPLPFTYYEK
jgi:hypothetical protein